MANILYVEKDKAQISDRLLRLFQSGNVNFLLGSGTSRPAIKTAGTIEQEIDTLFQGNKPNEANRKIYELLVDVQVPNNALISGTLARLPNEPDEAFNTRDGNLQKTTATYLSFVSSLGNMLLKRKSNLLRRQANIFTTNYDLFIEHVAEKIPSIRLNDGFGRIPSLANRFCFSSQNFFDVVYNTGNLYNYRVETPSINLVKIHGSLSWKNDGQNIEYRVVSKGSLAANATASEIEKFNKEFSLILPQQGKFRETMLDRVYYDLLRLYANELDKEGTLLITCGFSFGDAHIYDITRRALKNPTLGILVFAHSAANAAAFEEKFRPFNNVNIIAPEEDGNITLDDLTMLIRDVSGRKEEHEHQ